MNIISRREAYRLGYHRFYTGRPCHNGHLSERYVSSGNCIMCAKYLTKAGTVRGSNAGFPPRPIIFSGLDFTPTKDELDAAFLYCEAVGWLSEAVRRIHADPVLFARHMMPIDQEEHARLVAKLDQQNRTLAAIRSEAVENLNKCVKCGGSGTAYYPSESGLQSRPCECVTGVTK